jgi:hypothetical protein
MTRDETIAFLTPLFERRMTELGVTQSLTGLPLRSVANVLAHSVVNELPNLTLDPQYAYVSAELRRNRPPEPGEM